jgi:hypothetical protein
MLVVVFLLTQIHNPMKKVLLLVAFFIPLCLMAQKEPPVPFVDGKVTFVEVVTVDSSMKAAKLYGLAKQFTTSYWRNAKETIQNDDNINFVVESKGFTTYIESGLMGWSTKIWHTIRIECKDGRYRLTVTNFQLQGSPTNYEPNPQPVGAEYAMSPENYYRENGQPRPARERVKNEIELCVKNIKDGLQKTMKSSSSSDW